MFKKLSKYPPAFATRQHLRSCGGLQAGLPAFATRQHLRSCGGLQAGLPQIIAMLFLAGFVAYAWTEPASPPPDGNAPAPINVGSAAQTKQGDLIIGGNFRIDSDIIDKNGNVIYNSATGKIGRARLPF